ncbi:hypothetical protein [Actinoplanes utahensis]|uniref:PE domain-containing protein n=1 Tax=Actinoplanes utahensis TaxID=1869 RepID=A0A0A6UKR8_ACTUT|nr:hypothetical protein [Actinoplanes utahensis]KHD76715.1 hypothetical protein MB27_15630 [Actinoplanes utahensis]GIF33224.1 hypothetical protein Aut01nite_62100 [Actinoplanes utahensis]
MPENRGEVRVVLDALENEALKWVELADLMADLRGTAGGLGLNPMSFFCGDPLTASRLSSAYDDIFTLVQTLLKDAEAEFDQIAGALRIARDEYDGSDRTTASAFVRIYGE